MNSTQFRSIVEPVLNKVFDGIYDLRQDEWQAIFDTVTGIARAYHEEPVLFGMGAAPELPDGQAVTYQTGGELFKALYIYKVYGLAFALTKVLVEDGDHIRLGSIFSKHLAKAMIETKETIAANILNRAFNAAYKGGDQVSLINSAHPIRTGTFSNVLSTPAALSHTSLEQIVTQIMTAVDNNGKPIRLQGRCLVIPPQLVFQAETILNSALRSGTANNDLNAIKSLGVIPDGFKVVTRLTSATNWFIKTDASEGLKHMVRRKLTKSMEGDFDTDNVRYKSTERYAFGWTDPRCLFGTPGL